MLSIPFVRPLHLSAATCLAGCGIGSDQPAPPANRIQQLDGTAADLTASYGYLYWVEQDIGATSGLNRPVDIVVASGALFVTQQATLAQFGTPTQPPLFVGIASGEVTPVDLGPWAGPLALARGRGSLRPLPTARRLLAHIRVMSGAGTELRRSAERRSVTSAQSPPSNATTTR